ncbi:hypothetical protein [Acinetobacter sp. MD2(2019)]|uniref:hypothetical protein n=1 Tax=Acinetobacter sp. MD2(2019) TaxID=2605273 RepID=UPI002D1EDD3B|nr:hypothetical protein [Acinetobacter sp. MD2(2019)]MEB3755105.1 hypothetical protein [Acinetobacter sp. MD2(2019)]
MMLLILLIQFSMWICLACTIWLKQRGTALFFLLMVIYVEQMKLKTLFEFYS